MDLVAEIQDVFKAAKAPAKPRKTTAPKPKAPAKPKTTAAKPKAKAPTKPKAATTGRKAPATRGSTAKPWSKSGKPKTERETNELGPVHRGNFTCHSCGGHNWREHHVHTAEGIRHGALAFAGCTNCGGLHVGHVGMTSVKHSRCGGTWQPATHKTDDEVLDVGKDMDSSETALLRKGDGPTTDVVGHRANCPEGGSDPCGKDVDGECSKCGAQVRDHEAIGKTHATVLQLRALAGLS